jgi:hypothetical protein
MQLVPLTNHYILYNKFFFLRTNSVTTAGLGEMELVNKGMTQKRFLAGATNFLSYVHPVYGTHQVSHPVDTENII